MTRPSLRSHRIPIVVFRPPSERCTVSDNAPRSPRNLRARAVQASCPTHRERNPDTITTALEFGLLVTPRPSQRRQHHVTRATPSCTRVVSSRLLSSPAALAPHALHMAAADGRGIYNNSQTQSRRQVDTRARLTTPPLTWCLRGGARAAPGPFALASLCRALGRPPFF